MTLHSYLFVRWFTDTALRYRDNVVRVCFILEGSRWNKIVEAVANSGYR